jgi:heptaprenyl diphosphate synthase
MGKLQQALRQFREKRLKVYNGLFSAKILFIAGLLIMPAFLFSPPLFRLQLFFLFWFLAWLCGKKNNPLITISVILCIVAFNLLVPLGQVLYTIGGFRITGGALSLGIHRAVTLAGLIMLSRMTIRSDLKIPGLFGELIGESLKIFSVIMNQRQRITRKNLIANLDQMLIDLSDGAIEEQKSAALPSSRTKPLGFVLIAVVVLLVWSPWILHLISMIMRL